MSDARRARWEYRDTDDRDERDRLGIDGWEAYAATWQPFVDRDGFADGILVWHMRRPLAAES